jgi:hypothetical protein
MARAGQFVVGINEYKAAPPLGFATNDALAISSILESRFGFSREKISLLIDAEATREAITRAFLRLSTETAADERVVFFFAGHGHTPGERQQGQGADPGRP